MEHSSKSFEQNKVWQTFYDAFFVLPLQKSLEANWCDNNLWGHFHMKEKQTSWFMIYTDLLIE